MDINALEGFGYLLSDHIPNKEVCERTNRRENFMSYIVMKRQHTWLRHVLRMEPGRLPLVSLQAQFLDTRKKGGQKTRWVDSVLKFSGMSNIEYASSQVKPVVKLRGARGGSAPPPMIKSS